MRDQIAESYSNIVDSATHSEWVAGGSWYGNANSLALELAHTHNVTLESAASVLSAFSPLTPWARNVMLATEFLAGNNVNTLPASIATAERAMRMGFKAFSRDARKTFAFAHNIAGDLEHVTIDSHMVKATGCLDSSKKLSAGKYRLISDVVLDLASQHNVTPAQLQAIIWVTVRGSAD